MSRAARTILPIAVAVAGALATATPAAAAPRVGPGQYYVGLVNGRSTDAVLRMECPGPGAPGRIGRPLPGQTVAVRQLLTVDAVSPGFTGTAGREIVAFFSPSASSSASVSLTEYGVNAAIPQSILLPCAGSGRVTFSTRPSSPTARDYTLRVTFVS